MKRVSKGPGQYYSFSIEIYVDINFINQMIYSSKLKRYRFPVSDNNDNSKSEHIGCDMCGARSLNNAVERNKLCLALVSGCSRRRPPDIS